MARGVPRGMGRVIGYVGRRMGGRKNGQIRNMKS